MELFGTAVILAGGKSSRMGFDKQFLTIDNKRLIDKLTENLKKEFEEIIIVSNKRDEYLGMDAKVISDEIKEKGPLSGLHAGLKHSSSRFIYLTACDMPNINTPYIRFLKETIKSRPTFDAFATSREGRIEPFHAFYSVTLVEFIEKMVREDCRSLSFLIKKMNSLLIEEGLTRMFSPDWSIFCNLNTVQDVNFYLKNQQKETND